MPLSAVTCLRSRPTKIPSLVAEDTESTHDYLAIAVMFDTEQVLSYMWSAELPTGTVFACPLPRWKDRETHIVLYSGDAQLGQWLSEERQLLEDYARYKNGAMPKAIKQVWFIAGSSRQGGSGGADFSDVSIGDGTTDRFEILDQRRVTAR
jgi:hypothetical protein